MRKIILSILFSLLVLPTLAQSGTASLGGRVSDENGPIEGVTVVAIHQQTNAQYSVTTGSGGWWQLLDVLPGGPYTLRIHYFGYDPMTVRNVFTYIGQHTVIDVDLEAKSAYVHVDEASTSVRVGPELGGGTVPVSPLGFDLVSQRIYTPVVFDVRQIAPLEGMSEQWMAPTGSSRFHGAAYGFASVTPGAAGHVQGLGGLHVSTPLGNQDYQLFGGLQYGGTDGLQGIKALSGAARFDARLSERFRLDLSGGRLADGLAGAEDVGGQNWATAGLSASFSELVSMRLQTGWYTSVDSRQMLTSDDFTFAVGRHRVLAGVQFSYQNFLMADSTSTHGDIYVQDAIRLGRRLTLLAGVRFTFPFAFSPRLSLYYDALGNGRLVLRAGTAVYGVHAEGTVWKNLAAIDTRLPLDFKLTLEGVYGQAWRRAFYISSRNVLDSHYALTARLERPFAKRAWALASYTRSDGSVRDRVLGGFSYKAEYARIFATTVAVLYDGGSIVDDLSPASFSWSHAVEARLSQDFSFQAAGRRHTFQLTGYCRYAPAATSGSTGNLSLLAGLRYCL